MATSELPRQGELSLFTMNPPMTERMTDTPRRTWAEVVLDVLLRAEHEIPLYGLYHDVKEQAPELVARNPHWRDKVRQVLQRLRDQGLVTNTQKGVWSAVFFEK